MTAYGATGAVTSSSEARPGERSADERHELSDELRHASSRRARHRSFRVATERGWYLMAGNAIATSNNYFPDSYYSMQADKELEAFGRSTTLPTAFRLYLLAVARVNRWGHCPFGRGELRTLLGVSRPTLTAAMKSLQSTKMAAQESTPLCVVLSARAIRRADRSDTRCAEPGHFGRQELMWVHGYGWESGPGTWQGMLHDPMGRQRLTVEITRMRTTVTETETVRLTAAEDVAYGHDSNPTQYYSSGLLHGSSLSSGGGHVRRAAWSWAW
jgi:hypothetical protein